MPAEILNQLGSILPEIEASVAYKSTRSPRKTQNLPTLKAEMTAMKFIWNLPIISFDYLHGDEICCGICDCKYDDEFKVCSRRCSPCCLPCGHIAGHQCLRKHLSPYEAGFTRCPFCFVDFPQMFTDSAEPAEPTSELAWEDVKSPEVSEEELSRQVKQMTIDAGASADEVKRFLSIDEVLARPRNEIEGGTEARDFATETDDVPGIRDERFPKNRRMAASPALARAAMKAVDLIAKKF